VEARRAKGIEARAIIEKHPVLREVIDSIAMGVFSPNDRSRYASLVDALTYHDYFMVSTDFDAYHTAQRSVDARWRHQKSWWRSCILNIAGVAWFSSDRAIREYADQIWNVAVSPVR
jgi:starch phosphorylase